MLSQGRVKWVILLSVFLALLPKASVVAELPSDMMQVPLELPDLSLTILDDEAAYPAIASIPQLHDPFYPGTNGSPLDLGICDILPQLPQCRDYAVVDIYWQRWIVPIPDFWVVGATIRNTSSSYAGSGITVTLYIDGSFYGEAHTGAIEAGDTAGASVLWIPGADCYTIRATIDDGKDETNNWREETACFCTVPSAPSLLSPPNGSSTCDTTPTFDWSAVSDATTYHIQVDDDPDFGSSLNATTTSTTYSPESALLSGTYYWRVRASNSCGDSPWSSVRTVAILSAPSAPALSSPPDGGTISDSTPTLQWYSSPNANTYGVQVAEDAGFSSKLVDVSWIEGTSYTVSSSLQPGTYYWRVNATNLDSCGTGPWSAARRFNVEDCTGDGVYLYEHSNYQGRCQKWISTDDDFENEGFHDIASSIRFVGSYAGGSYVAILFEAENYGGPWTAFGADDPDFGDDLIGHDRASSIRFYSVPQCTGDGIYLYEGANYTGRCRKFTDSDAYLEPEAFDNIASSVRLAGSYGGGAYKVTLCDDSGYGGTCSTFTGDDNDLGNDAIGNDRTSSIQIEVNTNCTGDGVYLYEQPRYEGRCWKWINSDSSFQDEQFNDRAASLRFIGSYGGGKYVAILYEHTAYGGVSTQFTQDDNDLSNDPIRNYRASSIHITETRPDLVSDQIDWTPDPLLVGEEARFTVHVTNVGTIDTASWGRAGARLYVDGILVSEVYADNIRRGTTEFFDFEWTATRGCHEVRAVVDEGDFIPESDEGNNSRQETLCVQAPDLVMNQIDWAPDPSLADKRTSFTIHVSNSGTVDTASWGRVGTRLYVGDTLVGEVLADNIRPGMTEFFDFEWMAIQGCHEVRAIADEDGFIPEDDEQNNARRETICVSVPDLVTDQIDWTPDPPTVGNEVRLTVHVGNVGTADTSPWGRVGTRLYVDDALVGEVLADNIQPGRTEFFDFGWTATRGCHRVRAVADEGDFIPESDGHNNVWQETLCASAPDLVVDQIDWSPDPALVDREVSFTVHVKNDGTADTSSWGPVRTRLFIDDKPIGEVFTDNIVPGTNEFLDFGWLATPGCHEVRAVTDDGDFVPESNEANNDRQETVCVAMPDLVAEQIDWTPVHVITGTRVHLVVHVKNIGTVGTSPWGRVGTRLFIDGTSMGDVYVADVASGTTAFFDFYWTATSGSHVVRAVADYGDFIPESNEGQNARQETLCVLAATPALSSPSDRSRLTEAQPTFAWGSSSGARAYEIEVDNDPGFGSPELEGRVEHATYTATRSLAAGMYYWHVRSTNPCGKGVWSSRWSFTVLDAPTIRNLRESADPINKPSCVSGGLKLPTTSTILADVESTSSSVTSVRVYYRAPSRDWIHIAMSHSTGHTWTAELGPFGAAGTLEYFVWAQTAAGGEAETSKTTIAIRDCEIVGTSWNPQAHGLRFLNFGAWMDGNCLGMSLTSLDYSNAGQELPAEYNRWVPYPHVDRSNRLQCYVGWRQITSSVFESPLLGERRIAEPNMAVRNANEFQTLLGLLTSGRPVVLSLQDSNDKVDGHAVVVYEIRSFGSGSEHALLVYDSNYTSPHAVGQGVIYLRRTLIGGRQGLIFVPRYASHAYDELYVVTPPIELVNPATKWPVWTNPVTCALLFAAPEQTRASGYAPQNAFGGQLDSEGAAQEFTYHSSGIVPFLVLVDWTGGEVELALDSPDGSPHSQYSSPTAPLSIEVTDPEPGTYVFRVTALDLEGNDIPFVVVVGEKSVFYLPLVLSGF